MEAKQRESWAKALRELADRIESGEFDNGEITLRTAHGVVDATGPYDPWRRMRYSGAHCITIAWVDPKQVHNDASEIATRGEGAAIAAMAADTDTDLGFD